MSRQPDYSDNAGNLTLPLLLLTTAFFVMVAFQTYQLVVDRIALTNVRAAQEQNVQQSLKVRQQLNAIANGVQQLANGGDANAQQIIEALRRNGITVNAPAQPQPR